jgi:hypothetical protein
LILAGAAPAWAAGSNLPPTVYWASDPVRPGEAVLVTGDGLTADCAVELFRLADGPAGQPQTVQWPEKFIKPDVLQPRGQSLKLVLPADLATRGRRAACEERRFGFGHEAAEPA